MTTNTKLWRIIDLINWGTNHFTAKGLNNARRDMEWFLCEILTCRRIDLYVRFEEIGHSTELYAGGRKFMVAEVNAKEGLFNIKGRFRLNKDKKLRWCLAKDDVTPQDIFRLANEGPKSKAIVAKYCIQDCNLPHTLMIKNDVWTGFIEVASI